MKIRGRCRRWPTSIGPWGSRRFPRCTGVAPIVARERRPRNDQGVCRFEFGPQGGSIQAEVEDFVQLTSHAVDGMLYFVSYCCTFVCPQPSFIRNLTSPANSTWIFFFVCCEGESCRRLVESVILLIGRTVLPSAIATLQWACSALEAGSSPSCSSAIVQNSPTSSN